MQTTGTTLLLDLYDCKSPAIGSEAVLEHLFVSALQFAGLQVVDQLAHRFPNQETTIICILHQAHASLHAYPESGNVIADVCASGEPEVVRPALEIVRGYLVQKLIARSVNARFVERGLGSNASPGGR